MVLPVHICSAVLFRLGRPVAIVHTAKLTALPVARTGLNPTTTALSGQARPQVPIHLLADSIAPGGIARSAV